MGRIPPFHTQLHHGKGILTVRIGFPVSEKSGLGGGQSGVMGPNPTERIHRRVSHAIRFGAYGLKNAKAANQLCWIRFITPILLEYLRTKEIEDDLLSVPRG